MDFYIVFFRKITYLLIGFDLLAMGFNIIT